ncbi:DUF3667 domain-containing protein [Robiginitalea sp. M366]|uniref:DUF3667 domain-containing protein n=1 Tax=Robiginitalea aestuariiviva TaxID=3036903 RepID=UPI00240E2BA5|nr:DUF3667 domain-containing protein [Robiginitalea aestuariiviva]MDG1570815.1 DUF3667 domain-containing protein [Robiginitalea aestuariiviva]
METKPARRASRYKLMYRSNQCQNCGHPLDISDRYCPNCSQLNSTKKITMRDFAEEFFGSIIDYDSRLWRTITALVLRPGQISLDYVAGKRVSYTNPFRFLLSLAVIYFLLLNLGGDLQSLDRWNLDDRVKGVPGSPLNFEVQGDGEPQQAAQAVLDSLQHTDAGVIMEQISDESRKKDSALMADPKAYFEASSGGFTSRVFRKTDAFYNLMRRDTLYTFADADSLYGLPATRENRMSFNGALSLKRALSRPGTFLSDLISRLPFVTFFFLPVFTVFVWAVYIRKNYTYTDNLVFSFHNQSLFFILLIIGYLMDSLFGVDILGFCLLAFGIYLYAAMRRFYKQGHIKTFLKYVFLNTIFIILATFAGIFVLFSSAFTY